MPMAVVELLPLVLMRRVGVVTAEEFIEGLERLRVAMTASPVPCVAVYDAGTDPRGSPDARTRRLAAEWVEANEALLRHKLASLEFAAPNTISRGVLTAIFWLKTPPFETHFHARAEEAVAEAVRRTHTVATPKELLARLGAAAQALR